MANYTFNCPVCRKEIKADTTHAGVHAECPECKSDFVVPPPVVPPSMPPEQKKQGYELILVGWILFAVGMALICIPFCIPFFVISLIFGILAIAMHNRVGQGVALIACSVFIPLLSLLLVPFLLAGTFLAALSSENAVKPMQARQAQRIAPAQKLQIEVKRDAPSSEQAPIAMFLNEMDFFSREYYAADTSVLQEEIAKQAVEKAVALLKDIPQMTLTAPIKDVRNPSEFVTIVSFGDFDLGGFRKVPGETLYVSCWPQMKIEMKRSKALAVTPGSTFEITGTPVFEDSTKAIFGEPTPELHRIMVLTTPGLPGKQLGALMLKDPKWRILVKKQTTD